MAGIPDEVRSGVRKNLSVDQRVDLARKMKLLEPSAELSSDESRVLGEILLIIAQDAEVRVRQALSEALAANTSAPPEIVRALAKDHDLVALPMLRLSEVLKPADLVELIRSQVSGQKMEAIADRKHVPASVCLALIEHGDEKTANSLLGNHGADIPEAGFNRIVDRHGEATAIQTGIINRDTLPATVIDKIVTRISADLLSRMIERHKIPETASRRLVIEVRDRAVLGFTSGMSSDGMMNLVDQLLSEERLTPSLVLRSLIVGNIELVIHIMALECQLSPQYVRDRLIEGNEAAIEKLWTSAGLAPQYLQLAIAARNVLIEGRARQPAWTADYCRFQIIERFLGKCPDISRQLDEYDAAFLEAARSDSLANLAAMD